MQRAFALEEPPAALRGRLHRHRYRAGVALIVAVPSASNAVNVPDEFNIAHPFPLISVQSGIMSNNQSRGLYTELPQAGSGLGDSGMSR